MTKACYHIYFTLNKLDSLRSHNYCHWTYYKYTKILNVFNNTYLAFNAIGYLSQGTVRPSYSVLYSDTVTHFRHVLK